MWLNSIFGFCWIWGARLLACRSCLLGWAICTLLVWSRLFLYLQASFVAVNQMDGKILSPTAPIPVSYEDAPNTTQYNVFSYVKGSHVSWAMTCLPGSFETPKSPNVDKPCHSHCCEFACAIFFGPWPHSQQALWGPAAPQLQDVCGINAIARSYAWKNPSPFVAAQGYFLWCATQSHLEQTPFWIFHLFKSPMSPLEVVNRYVRYVAA